MSSWLFILHLCLFEILKLCKVLLYLRYRILMFFPSEIGVGGNVAFILRFISWHVFSPWQSLSELSAAHLA